MKNFKDNDTTNYSRSLGFEREERPTLRCFSVPKEKVVTPAKRHENALHERIRDLEAEVNSLTDRLGDREQELLEALTLCEEGGLL